MIEIVLAGSGSETFEYDIRGLVMAFFPGEAIHCTKEGEAEPEAAELTLTLKTGQGFTLTVSDGEHDECERKDYPGAGTDHTTDKTMIKNTLYRMLANFTGRELVWGTLTGIRPTKIPMAALEQGMSPEDAAQMMQDTYLVSEKKSKISSEIALQEKKLLEKIDYEQGYSLYIGIPFCPTKCLYCSFTSYPIGTWEKKLEDYVDALIREMDYVAQAFRDKKLNTIYIGGGTPTTLTPELSDRLLNAIEERFSFDSLLEFTVEGGRPDSITREKLQVLHRHSAVSRISINPQTMKQETLDLIGRRHTVEQVKEAFAMAREEGFDNINMDIILGLPNETVADVKDTMEELKTLRPDNVTVHTLALKRASRLNTESEYGMYRFRVDPQQVELMMDAAEGAAREMGMKPYYLYRQKNMAGNLENVGYAMPGKAGIYNILIMEEKQTIVALGAGAVTKRVYPDGLIERCDNVKDVKLYIEKIDEMIERKRALFGR